MKVLRVISSMNPSHGGPCQGIRNSIPALKALAIDNEVVSLDDPQATYLGSDDFTIHAIGASKGPWAYNGNLEGWLVKHLPKYDAIIVHGLWLYHSYAVYRALKKLKKSHRKEKLPKFYVMPHGMLDPYFQKVTGRKLKALRNTLYWKLIEAKVVNEADGVLFTCEEELKLARIPFSPYHPKKELNVSYGIIKPKPFEEQMAKELGEKVPAIADKPYLLFLSRIHEKKGVDILIKAYAKIKNSGVGDLPNLMIAGPGLETTFGAYVQGLASKTQGIFFPGMLTSDLKWAAFYGCEAFILPSHQENFGIAVVEALACGKPVLITNQVNIWREIQAEGAGLVNQDTQEGVEQLLINWLGVNQQEKVRMSQNAITAYQKYFTIEKAAKKMAEVINFREGQNA